MTKKRFVYAMFALLVTASLSIVIFSCSDDKDDDNAAVGTWYGEDHHEYLKLTFRSNGKGIFIVGYSDSTYKREDEPEAFTYKMEGSKKGKIFIEDYDSYYGRSETETMYFEIDGKTMSIYDDGYGGDLEWVLTKQ